MALEEKREIAMTVVRIIMQETTSVCDCSSNPSFSSFANCYCKVQSHSFYALINFYLASHWLGDIINFCNYIYLKFLI